VIILDSREIEKLMMEELVTSEAWRQILRIHLENIMNNAWESLLICPLSEIQKKRAEVEIIRQIFAFIEDKLNNKFVKGGSNYVD
jgi:hypothetical protein